MKIEAVIVSKGYGDFLAHTLPDNLNHLDDVVVVTSHDDVETQKVCARLSVDCLRTDCFTEGGDAFNKGRAINMGLAALRKRDWLLHIDADILLPHRYREMLEKAHLDPKNIYGCDRVNIYGFENYMALKPKLVPHHSDKWFVDPGFCHHKDLPAGTRLGARVVHMEHGFVPIGFHQLWHASQGRQYNYKLGAAAGADVLFPAQWPRRNRVLLPEVVVYHLDSEPIHGIGTNWKGRKSRPFGPSCECHKKHKHGHHCHCHCHHKHPHYCP